MQCKNVSSNDHVSKWRWEVEQLITIAISSFSNVLVLWAAAVLNHISQPFLFGGIALYGYSAHWSENVGLAYSTTQKAVKHLVDSGVLLSSKHISVIGIVARRDGVLNLSERKVNRTYFWTFDRSTKLANKWRWSGSISKFRR